VIIYSNNKEFMKYFFLLGLFALVHGISAQVYLEDASLYSTNSLGGTARFQGFGGAGTSLGADLSMGYLNPAGLGAYRKSEFSATMGIGSINTRGTYFGDENSDNRMYLYFPNFGIAFSSAKDDIEKGDFRGGTFAITYNKINDFQNQVFYSGYNERSNITQSFTNLLQNSGQSDLDLDYALTELPSLEALIFQSLLVEYDFTNVDNFNRELGFYNPNDSIIQDDGSYIYNPSSKRSYQEQTISTRGAQNQFDFAYGGNFSDKYYIGASLGIVSLRHLYNRDYYEKLDYATAVEQVYFGETVKTTGTGFNFKIGFIARPIEALRIGISVQTPTAYFLSQDYQYSLRGIFNPSYVVPGTGTGGATGSGYYPEDEENSTIPLTYKYRVTTPAIVRGGVSWFFGKSGFLTADIEYVPYQMLKLGEANNRTAYRYENRVIKNEYSGSINYKFGTEIRQGIYRYRAGFAHYSNPLNKLDNINRSRNVFTIGFGLKWEMIYLDMAIVHSRFSAINSPYSMPVASPVADLANRNTGVVFTFGSNF
jgi:hypothetical protein